MRFRIMALAALTALSFAVAGCGQVKVGYIDQARVVEESPQLKSVVEEANQKLEEAQKQAEEELSQKQDMTDEEFQKFQTDTQRKLMGLNQAYATQLRQKLDVAVAGVVKDKELDTVVESSKDQRVVVRGGVDVTDEVIQKLQ